MEDDDEDVILSNSPLYDYINELNLSQENEAFIKEIKSTSELKNTPISSSNSFEEHSKQCDVTFIQKIWNFLNYICTAFLSHPFALEHSVLNNYLERNISTGLLIEEDRSFVQSWHSMGSIPSYRLIVIKILSILLVLFSVLIVVFINTSTFNVDHICCFDVLYNVDKFTYFSLFLLSLLILVLNVAELLEVIFMWYCFEDLIHNTKTLNIDIKNCIRLIQEAELIARGFTATSMFSLAEKIESIQNLPFANTRRHYIELRKYTYGWIKEIFMAYRNSTLALINFACADQDLDFTHNCLAKLDLKEFGIMFHYNLNSDFEYSELVKVTDNFSITSLKILLDLMEIQVSEFFKCVYLTSFAYAKYEAKSNALMQFLKSNHYRKRFFKMCKQINLLLKKVKSKYKYYRCFEVANLNKPKKASEKSPDQSNVAVAIHNMSLHLKAALWRILEIEDKMKNKYVDIFKDKSVAQELVSLLLSVKSEVAGYEEYFDECHVLLTEILDPKQVLACPKLLELKSDDKLSRSAGNSTKKCDIEPDIQDEVFEDIISYNASESNALVDRTYHQDDCQKNVRLLKELKNVLVIKADEHIAREKIALAKKQNKPYSTNEDHKKKSTFTLEDSIKSLAVIKNKTCLNELTMHEVTEISSDENRVQSLPGTIITNHSNKPFTRDTTEISSDEKNYIKSSCGRSYRTYSKELFTDEKIEVPFDKDNIQSSSENVFQTDLKSAKTASNLSLDESDESSKEIMCDDQSIQMNRNRASCNLSKGFNDNVSSMEQKCPSNPVVLSERQSTFASAIASMAAQKRQMLGLTTEEFMCDISSDEAD